MIPILNLALIIRPQVPKTTKSIILRQAGASADQKSVLHDAVIEERVIPKLEPGHVLVRINAAAFNHRDVSTDCLYKPKFLSFTTFFNHILV